MKHAPNHDRPRARDLVRDTRGAFMVLGVFVSLFLVALLWSIAGTGEAILFKERVQEATDATAFAGAAVDARAMNILVLYNLMVTAVLSVRVVIKSMLIVSTALVPSLSTAAKDLYGTYNGGIDRTLTQFANAQSGIDSATNATAVSAGREVAALYSSVIEDNNAIVAGDVAGAGTGLPVQFINGGGTLCGGAGDAAYWEDPSTPGKILVQPVLVDKLLDEESVNTPTTKAAVLKTIQALDYSNYQNYCEMTPGVAQWFEMVSAGNWESGCAFAQVFVSVPARLPLRTLSTGLVKAATKNQYDPVTLTPALSGYAQAQFFFDCPSNWDTCWTPAPWAFYWRPRLRLFNPVSLAIVGAKGNWQANAILGDVAAGAKTFTGYFTNQTLKDEATFLITNRIPLVVH